MPRSRSRKTAEKDINLTNCKKGARSMEDMELHTRHQRKARTQSATTIRIGKDGGRNGYARRSASCTRNTPSAMNDSVGAWKRKGVKRSSGLP